MRAALIAAAWLLTGILALAALTGYGAARAAVPALAQFAPPVGAPSGPAFGPDGRHDSAPRPAPELPAAGPDARAGEVLHLAAYAHLVDHVQQRAGWSDARSGELAALLIHEGLHHGVDPWLLAAVIEVESGFRVDAVGSAGEIGLMQILPGTARRVAHTLGIAGFSEDALFEPELNVRLGAALLGDLLARHRGDPVAALTAYNTGRSTSTNGFRYAYRVLAVADRVSGDVRVAWTPDAPH